MIKEFVIPDLGEEDTEGTILGIAVEVGNEVQVGDLLLEVETDKVVLEVPSTLTGTITEILIKADDIVNAGMLFMRVDIGAAEVIEINRQELEPVTEVAHVVEENRLSAVRNPSANILALAVNDTSILPAGPAARRLARELGVELGNVIGSGEGGRISKADVKSFVKRAQTGTGKPRQIKPNPAQFGEIESFPLSRMEKTTAQNMSHAASEIAHAWVQTTIDITDLENARKANKARLALDGHAVTLTAILCKVLSLALKQFPRFNSVLDMDTSSVIHRRYINIGVAVDTPRGLVVPSLKGIDRISILDIADRLTEISELARTAKLKPNDLKGAGFTLSNLGGLGVSGIFPIVNWPEVAILGVAAGKLSPVMMDTEFVPRLLMPVTLGFDHRVINGADAARFLAFIKEHMESEWLLTVN